MIYFITNLGANAISEFIENESIQIENFELFNYFNVSVNKSSTPRKYVVEIIYHDTRCNNIIQLTSINLHSKEKAERFAKGICKNNKFINKLNF